jgi:hypothetical protein
VKVTLGPQRHDQVRDRAGGHRQRERDDTRGLLIADAMDRVGKERVITGEEAKSIDTTLEVV